MALNMEIVSEIEKNLEDLENSIHIQKSLLESLSGKKAEGKSSVNKFFRGKNEKVYKEALRETIRVLDESRSSFKSKRLETLRKKLTDILTQDSV